MNHSSLLSRISIATAIGMLTSVGFAQTTPAAPVTASAAASAPATMAPAANPYKVLKTVPVGSNQGSDYVFADADGRRLYFAQSGNVSVYDLDTLKLVGAIAARAHGAVVDPKYGHGFTASNPVVMFDTKTLATIKSIPMPQGASPDGFFLEPLTDRIYILSHPSPNVIVIDANDGSIVGTIDLGGAPEQGGSDGKGHAYIDVSDKANIAVVDVKTLAVTAHYDLGDKSGSGPAGLAVDGKNGILFAYSRNPANAIIVNAADGKIITTLPTGSGVDAAEFNPATMEAFCSAGVSGNMTVIKENSPTDFVVEQTIKTFPSAKCSTLDSKTNQIFLIGSLPLPPTAPTAGTAASAGTAPAATSVAAMPATTAAPATTSPAASSAVASATPAGTAPAGTTGTAPATSGRRGGGRGGPPGIFSVIVVGQ